MGWSGEEELKQALRELASSKGTSATRIRNATQVALKNIKEYKRVVHAVEHYLWKADPEHRLAGLYTIDSILRQSRKNGSKEQLIQRFLMHMSQTLNAIKGIPEDQQPSARRIIHEWQTKGYYKAEDIIKANGKDYVLLSSEPQGDITTTNYPMGKNTSNITETDKLSSLLSILKKQKEKSGQQTNNPTRIHGAPSVDRHGPIPHEAFHDRNWMNKNIQPSASANREQNNSVRGHQNIDQHNGSSRWGPPTNISNSTHRDSLVQRNSPTSTNVPRNNVSGHHTGPPSSSICNSFSTTGYCHLADKCTFLHDYRGPNSHDQLQARNNDLYESRQYSQSKNSRDVHPYPNFPHQTQERQHEGRPDSGLGRRQERPKGGILEAPNRDNTRDRQSRDIPMHPDRRKPPRIQSRWDPPNNDHNGRVGNGPKPSQGACIDFIRGRCERGDSCRMVHVRDTGDEKRLKHPSSPRREICRNFQRGRCNLGNACRYEHVPRRDDNVHHDRLDSRWDSQSSKQSSIGSTPNKDRDPVPPIAPDGREVCMNFQRNRCKFGSACRHAHIRLEDLNRTRSSPKNQRANQTSMTIAPDETIRDADGNEICMNFHKGKCKFGDRCHYVHSMNDPNSVDMKQAREAWESARLKTKMCANFPLGNCRFGDKCNFAHSESELRPDPKSRVAPSESEVHPRGGGALLATPGPILSNQPHPQDMINNNPSMHSSVPYGMPPMHPETHVIPQQQVPPVAENIAPPHFAYTNYPPNQALQPMNVSSVSNLPSKDDTFQRNQPETISDPQVETLSSSSNVNSGIAQPPKIAIEDQTQNAQPNVMLPNQESVATNSQSSPSKSLNADRSSIENKIEDVVPVEFSLQYDDESDEDEPLHKRAKIE